MDGSRLTLGTAVVGTFEDGNDVGSVVVLVGFNDGIEAEELGSEVGNIVGRQLDGVVVGNDDDGLQVGTVVGDTDDGVNDERVGIIVDVVGILVGDVTTMALVTATVPLQPLISQQP